MFSKLIQQTAYTFARNKLFIGGNWKSNNTIKDSIKIVNTTINGLKYNPDKVDVIISPVNLHIPGVLAELKHPNVKVAAQNASTYGFGAYTGQVSPKHLKDYGLQWVILGHSQRRTIYKQNDELIVNKTKLALQNGLKVIFCFGETLQERKYNKTWDVLHSQLTPLLKALPCKQNQNIWLNSIVLAYQPVWAIGTGINSSPQQTQQVFTWLRQRLSKEMKQANKIRIIYGGSANGKNAQDYIKIQSVDGLLVGGASLKPEFSDMVKVCDQAK